MRTKPLIFRNLNFGSLWLSQTVSLVGSRIYQIALIWWLLSNSDGVEGKFIGPFMIATVLPSIIFSKWIGQLVDNSSSKRVLLLSDCLGLLLSLVMLGIFYSGNLNIYIIVVSAFLFSSFYAFIGPTLNRSVPLLVDQEEISEAVSFMSSTELFANVAGALFGALLVEWFGLFYIIVINGASYLISILCDYYIQFREINKSACHETEMVEENYDIDQMTGRQLLNKFPNIRNILFAFAGANLFAGPTFVILPIYVKRALMGGASHLGIYEGCMWFGMLAGTFYHWFLGFKSKTAIFSGISMLVFGGAMILAGLFVNYILYGLLLFIAAFFIGALNVRIITLFQLGIPDRAKGRFFAVLQAATGLVIPVGYAIFSVLADNFSINWPLYIQGVGTIIIATIFLIKLRMDDDKIIKADCEM